MLTNFILYEFPVWALHFFDGHLRQVKNGEELKLGVFYKIVQIFDPDSKSMIYMQKLVWLSPNMVFGTALIGGLLWVEFCNLSKNQQGLWQYSFQNKMCHYGTVI